MAKVKLPEGGSSVSWNGETYTANKKGIADVPEAAIEDLKPHGVELVEDQAATAE